MLNAIQIQTGFRYQKIELAHKINVIGRMSDTLTSCQTQVSTFFIFGTPQTQNAAETIYLQKVGEYASSISGLPTANNVRHDVNLMFKTDYERMQYLMGLYGRESQGRR
jgi:hypothetical protein